IGKCIYELNDDVMKLCLGEPNRPTEFKTAPGSDDKLYYWKREARDRSDDAAKNIPPLSSDDLRGKWTGMQNDIKVELTIYGQQARWQAHWQVEYKKPQKRPRSWSEVFGLGKKNPPESSTTGVNKGADLK